MASSPEDGPRVQMIFARRSERLGASDIARTVPQNLGRGYRDSRQGYVRRVRGGRAGSGAGAASSYSAENSAPS